MIYESHCFLAKGGTALLEADNPREFCEENGLFLDKIEKIQDITYLHIIADKTDLSAFYTFHESDSVEVWRTFLTVKGDVWTVNFSLDTIYLSDHQASEIVSNSLRICNYL